MNIGNREIAARITDAVREACVDQNITQGAIGVTFAYPDNTLDSYVDSVVKGGDTIGRDAEGKELGDCADVVAKKIASVLKSIEYYQAINPYPGRSKYTSGALPEEFVQQGMTNWKGGIGIPVGVRLWGGCGCRPCGYAGTDAFTICVAVSGGKQEQDEAAAWAALSVVRKIVKEEPEFMTRRDFWEMYDGVDGEVDRYVEDDEQ